MEREVVIVTGGSGLIGTATARRLAPKFEVIGLDRKPPRRQIEGVTHVDLDLTSDHSVADAFAGIRRTHGTRIASVIHLAAYYDFSGAPSPLYEEVTLRGTGRLLAALRAFECEQLVFSSSMLVHAPTKPGQPIDETWSLEPKWDYPRSKVETEELLHLGRGDLPILLLRIAGVYDDHCHSIPIANQIDRIRRRTVTSRVFPGDTSHGQAFVHLDDVVEAFALAIAARKSLPEDATLLIAEEDVMSYQQLQKDIGRLLHHEEWETTHIPKAMAKAGAWMQEKLPGTEPFIRPWMIDLADDHYEIDTRRARHLLGWEPRHSLRESLPRMIANLQADPEAWYRQNGLPIPEAERPEAQP